MKMDELEKQISRINALEVHVKKLLVLEKELQASGHQASNKEKWKQSKRGEALDTQIDQILAKKFSECVQIEKQLTEKIQALEAINSHMNRRLEELERENVSLKEVQAKLENTVEELMQKCHDDEDEEAIQQVKNIYIDKFYLDKYEQNNNFAQLGIKTLSGTLNIGATYGIDAIPKEINEQAKNEWSKLKAIMEKERERDVSEGEESTYEEPQENDLESDEEDSAFTDINIEEEDF